MIQSEPNVRVEVERGVAIVTLDRPPVNSVDLATYDQLRRVFHAVNDDPDVRVVVFTGAGKVFCGGNDVNDFVDMDFHGSTEYLAHVRLCFNAIYDCKVPVVGAINGSAVGTGIVLASLCDFRVASSSAKFALPEIDVGVLGGAGHVARLATKGITRFMAYTGRRFTAEEAKGFGVIDFVVAPEQVMAEAMQYANEIADKSPVAIRLSKEGLNRLESMNLKEGYEYECTLTAAVRRTPEATEGARAFLEKRQPAYAASR